MKDWKIRSLITGAGMGALIGTAAAFLFVRQAEKTGEAPKLNARHGVNIGMSILNFLRMFTDLGNSGK
jgi:hypothetical protein